MKNLAIILVVVSMFGINSASADAIVEDNFNSYADGSVVGQGGWQAHHEPWEESKDMFIVQGDSTFEGAKALHCDFPGDNVITKTGESLSDGRQVLYIKSEDRDSWLGTSLNGNILIRITDGDGWGGSSFCQVGFRKNGEVVYSEVSNLVSFASYNDNEWTRLAVEWRSLDAKARYQINGGAWTDWKTFNGSLSFTAFRTVGIDFDLREGSGGMFIDTLGVPEPTTVSLLLIGGLAILRRKRK